MIFKNNGQTTDKIASNEKEKLSNDLTKPFESIILVPLTGLEPVRYCYRGILSPLCLPISPQRQRIYYTPEQRILSSLFPKFNEKAPSKHIFDSAFRSIAIKFNSAELLWAFPLPAASRSCRRSIVKADTARIRQGVPTCRRLSYQNLHRQHRSSLRQA